MCALRAHIKLSIFVTFSIFEKIFPNIESLMCALIINRTHIINAKLIRNITS